MGSEMCIRDRRRTIQAETETENKSDTETETETEKEQNDLYGDGMAYGINSPRQKFEYRV